jgi:hypothetical protein
MKLRLNWFAPMCFVKELIKISIVTFILVMVGFFILIDYSDLPVIHGAIQSVYACLDPGFDSNELPNRASITRDGRTATFHKGTPAYNQFVTLLQRRRTLAMENDWPTPPSFGTRVRCGELTIWSYGIAFHFLLYNSTENQNYYWIRVPCSTGMRSLDFYDDGKLLKLIHDPDNLSGQTNPVPIANPVKTSPALRHSPLFYGK